MFQHSFQHTSGLHFETKPPWNPSLRNLGDHPHYVVETGSQDFNNLSWLGGKVGAYLKPQVLFFLKNIQDGNLRIICDIIKRGSNNTAKKTLG